MPDLIKDRCSTITGQPMTHWLMTGKILPKFPTDKRQKCGAILVSLLGSVASSIIGLAYKGISSFL